MTASSLLLFLTVLLSRTDSPAGRLCRRLLRGG